MKQAKKRRRKHKKRSKNIDAYYSNIGWKHRDTQNKQIPWRSTANRGYWITSN